MLCSKLEQLTDNEKSKSVLEDPLILILSCKLSSLTQILPVLEKCHQTNKPLFIIANDYDQEAIQALVANISKGLLQICAVRSPFYGDKRNQILNDSTLFVECSSSEDSKDILLDIQKKLDDKSITKEEEAFYKQRLVISKGVVAVLSIGAHTESELLELVDRIDDALHATKAAMESGFLPGGGTALAKAGITLLNNNSTEDGLLSNTVSKIVADACMTPLKQILKNADLPVDYIIENVKIVPDFTYGYDVRNEEYTDMIVQGIIDPQKVTATALKNAVSVSNSLISVGCVVLNTENYDQGVQLVQLSDDMY